MEKLKYINFKSIAFVLICLSFILSMTLPSMAAGPAQMKLEATSAETVTLTMGKSIIIESPETIKRVALANPAVSDAMVLSPRQIYLSAKTPGVTSLTLWGTGDSVSRMFDLEVVPDINRLKEKLHTMFPNEKDIKVSASHDNLTLSGTASNAAALSQVLEIAKAYAPAAKEGQFRLVNLLEVGGVQQVMLEVRVSEMSTTLGRRLGINFGTVSSTGQQFGLSLLNNLTNLANVQGYPVQQKLNYGGVLTTTSNEAGYPVAPLGVSGQVNSIIRFLSGGASWTVFIDALKENGLVKVLAEPTLITLSGKEAKFLAGGEFPIPVPDQDGRVTIQYKPFGVALNFTPIVLSNGKINMQVAPEVSELDFTTAVALQGFVIPSVNTRRVATTVELADGQSFAVAGLIKEEMRETAKKFPFLGDIPVLGHLFRSNSYQKRDTELVIIVTPHLVKPLDMAKQTLPTDQFVEPDDLEFYILGASEGRGQPGQSINSSPQTGQRGSSLEGKFGHITPK
jgi:pilus assembly protein CpaC